MLTDNALNATRNVIVPVQAETTSLRALDLLFDQIESIEKGLNIRINIVTVVPNLVQDSGIAERTLTSLKENVPVLSPTIVRKRVVLQSAWTAGSSIFTYEPESRSEREAKTELMAVFCELTGYVIQK